MAVESSFRSCSMISTRSPPNNSTSGFFSSTTFAALFFPPSKLNEAVARDTFFLLPAECNVSNCTGHEHGSAAYQVTGAADAPLLFTHEARRASTYPRSL